MSGTMTVEEKRLVDMTNAISRGIPEHVIGVPLMRVVTTEFVIIAVDGTLQKILFFDPKKWEPTEEWKGRVRPATGKFLTSEGISCIGAEGERLDMDAAFEYFTGALRPINGNHVWPEKPWGKDLF